MSEGKHEPARFVPDIEVPTDLKAMHRLEHNPEADVNRQRPPAEAQMAIGVIHEARTKQLSFCAKRRTLARRAGRSQRSHFRPHSLLPRVGNFNQERRKIVGQPLPVAASSQTRSSAANRSCPHTRSNPCLVSRG